MRMPMLAALVVLLAGTNLHAQQSDIDISRTHVWSSVTYKAKFAESDLGVVAKFSSRYDIDFEKEVNGGTTDDEAQGSWINELFVGPSYSTKLSPNVGLTTSPQYRPMFWYAGEAKDSDPASFVEHSIHWPTAVTYKMGSMTLKYRLILWNRFATEYDQGGTTRETDNEFLTRHYVGVSFPVSKAISLSLAEEVFLLHTADEDQESFWRNAVWAEATIKTGVRGLAAQVGYANYFTFKEDSAARNIDVNDHYLRLGLVYGVKLGA